MHADTQQRLCAVPTSDTAPPRPAVVHGRRVLALGRGTPRAASGYGTVHAASARRTTRNLKRIPGPAGPDQPPGK